MPAPRTLLPWLIGGAIGAAGIFQGLHLRSSGSAVDQSDLENQLRIAGEENEMLKRENESLRSLAQGGGELAVPQEFIDRVEKECGLRFRSTPVVHRASGDELGDRIAAAIENRYGPSGIDDRQEAYRLIGWLRPDDDLLTQLAAVRSVGASSWFDELAGDGWVTGGFDLKNIPDQASLVRLLVRILIYQHFPPPTEYSGDDAERAREALHQGAAASAEAGVYAANARVSGFIPLKENSAAGQLLASLPPFLRGLTVFPGIAGKALADTLHVQGNGSFHAALRQPPRTTRAVLYPGEPFVEPKALDLPAPPEEPFLTESAGLLGLRLWLEPAGDAAAVAKIAAAWKNDRYILFPDGEVSSAVLWDIELEDTGAADLLEHLARGLVEEWSKTKAPNERHRSVSRSSPKRVRFLNTAEAGTAATLGSKQP